MDAERRPTDYDVVAYPSHTLVQTHPDRLGTVARLLGLDPAPADRCRVLELGCHDGANLMPMAEEFPGSAFVGIDLAASAVERGRALAAGVGLGNLDLRAMDVMEVGPDLGRFDYVVAHGLYSWVPEPVREKILSICRENLSDRGVAYVSYNALPGCHIRRILRDLLLFHAGPVEDPAERIRQAKAILHLLVDSRPSDDTFSRIVAENLERAAEKADALLFHDDMSPVNAPCYFTDFVARAERHGLQYLSESDYHTTQAGTMAPRAAELLERLSRGDEVRREQYLDFLVVRRFRETLLVPAGARIDRSVPRGRARSFFASTALDPGPEAPDLHSDAEHRYSMPRTGGMRVHQPFPKAVLAVLCGAKPRALSFGEILDASRALLGRAGAEGLEEDSADLEDLLLRSHAAGVLRFHGRRPPVAAEPGERPRVARLARHLSRVRGHVPNLHHENVVLENDILRAFLPLLDGTRDRGALLRDLAAAAARGEFSVEAGGRRLLDPAEITAALSGELEATLLRLARAALLTDSPGA